MGFRNATETWGGPCCSIICRSVSVCVHVCMCVCAHVCLQCRFISFAPSFDGDPASQAPLTASLL